MIKPKSPNRFYLENQIYFVTTKTDQRFEYFREAIFCDLLIENLRVCKRLKQFELYSFCLLYDHLHLLLKPNEKYNISKVVKSLKENVSCDINRIMNINVGETPTSHLQRIYRNKEINFNSYRRKFIKEHGRNQTPTPKFRWQPSFHDHMIRNEKDFRYHYHYTVYNFQKHNLSKNWKYTSLNSTDLIDEFPV